MLIYYQEALNVLLEIELSGTENDNEEYIESIINLASIKHCKKLVDELAEKHTSANILKINKLLKNTTLSIDEINNNNEDAVQSYYNTENILDYLTYENNPKDYDLYEYLLSFDYIRINYNLEDLYLLLYYDKIIEFKNDDVMELLKLKIIMSRFSQIVDKVVLQRGYRFSFSFKFLKNAIFSLYR